jgi:hypothetical protein
MTRLVQTFPESNDGIQVRSPREFTQREQHVSEPLRSTLAVPLKRQIGNSTQRDATKPVDPSASAGYY